MKGRKDILASCHGFDISLARNGLNGTERFRSLPTPRICRGEPVGERALDREAIPRGFARDEGWMTEYLLTPNRRIVLAFMDFTTTLGKFMHASPKGRGFGW